MTDDQPGDGLSDQFSNGASAQLEEPEDQHEEDLGDLVDDGDEDPDESEDPEPTRGDRARERASEISDSLAAKYGQVGFALQMLMLVPLMLILRKVPISDKLADALIERGFELKQELSGADVLVFSAYGDKKVFPRPAKWQSEGQCYLTSNGEKYSAKGEGHNPYYLFGSIPVTFTLRKSAEVFEPIQAYVAQQRDLGNWISKQGDDGKQNVLVGSNPPGEADGMVLSWEKAFEMHYQKVTQENLQEQFDLGKLSALNQTGQLKVAILVLGAFVGGAVFLLAILFVISRWFTGGGSSDSIVLVAQSFGVI